jgi:hypothetical protein
MNNIINKTNNNQVFSDETISESDFNIISHILYWKNTNNIEFLNEYANNHPFKQIDNLLLKTYDYTIIKNIFKDAIFKIKDHFPSYNEGGICETCGFIYELPEFIE